MPAYQYTPLDPSSAELRLVTILPGEFDDPLRVQITHATQVRPTPRKKPKRLSLGELQKTLPTGWLVYETSEGRVIFYNGEEDGLTSWEHPDPLFPRNDYDPLLEGDIDVTGPSYEALSYPWGSAQDKEAIIVEGNTESSVLSVTHNLAEALRHFRYSDQPRVMWIDAICIDQNNIDERNVQVKRMGDIYALANRVVAWLGPSSSSSGLAMATLEYIGKQIQITQNRFYISAPGCQEKDWCDFDKPLPYKRDVWDAIKEIVACSWFERLWIIQEIHLANTKSIVKCGHHEVPWPLFRRAILTIHGKEEGVPEDVREELYMLHNICVQAGNRTFDEALYEFHDRKCADARDKVYGLMNLAPQDIRNAISVDYSKPALEAFKQGFYACARVENRLGQLRFAGRRNRDPSSLPLSDNWPSWVPDWSGFVRMTAHPNSGFCASGISPASWAPICQDKIAAHGVLVGSVVSVSEPITEDEEFLGASMLAKFELPQKKDQPYPTGESYSDACIQALVLGHLKDRWVTVSNYPLLMEIKEALLSSAIFSITDVERNKEDFAISDFYMQDCQGQHKGSRVFSILSKNKDRYIGIMDGQVQAGKLIIDIPIWDIMRK